SAGFDPSTSGVRRSTGLRRGAVRGESIAIAVTSRLWPDLMSTSAERHLYVAWRRPEGLIVPVGRLTQQSGPESTTFRFVYLKGAERYDDFPGLPGLTDLHGTYESQALFPVFANRVMPRDRADYGSFVEQLDLSVEADPFEVLGRSEGIRETDRIEVFPGAEAA